jgi:hypothetical protein
VLLFFFFFFIFFFFFFFFFVISPHTPNGPDRTPQAAAPDLPVSLRGPNTLLAIVRAPLGGGFSAPGDGPVATVSFDFEECTVVTASAGCGDAHGLLAAGGAAAPGTHAVALGRLASAWRPGDDVAFAEAAHGMFVCAAAGVGLGVRSPDYALHEAAVSREGLLTGTFARVRAAQPPQ